jgi:peroxin-3
VLEGLPCEQLTQALQQQRAERLARASGEGASEASSQRDGDTASLSSFQTGSFVHASQFADGQSGPRKSKSQLWNELKVTSITRAMTLIYSLSLLTILTRIQLNLLGRLNYLSSVIALAQPPQPGQSSVISLEDHDDATANINFGNDFETNRRYLTFSWYLLHRGYGQIMAKVRTAVEDVFGSVSPAEGLTAERLRELVMSVRKQVEGSSEQERYAMRWLQYVLPPREEEESLLVESGVITPPSSSSAELPEPTSNSGPNRGAPSYINTSTGPLRSLLDETADLIDSPTFTRIHTLILNTLFSHLIDQRVIMPSYPQANVQSPPASEASGQHPRIQELDSAVTVVPGEPRVKLASILAILTRQAHVIGNGNNPPNEYVAAVEAEVRELEAFAAVIYTSNLEQSVEEARPPTAKSEDEGIKSSAGTGVSDVGAQQVDEMIESKLEGAWSRVVGSSGFTGR